MIRDNPEQLIKNYSVEIGKNILKIQAGGGNTSWKEESIMWIKASGTWLKDAMTKDIFVPVKLKDVDYAMTDPENEDGKIPATELNGNKITLRPSIETTLHGVIPYKYVVHTHDLGIILHAVQKNGEAELTELLKEMNPVCVPYVKPGKKLAEELLNQCKSLPAFPKTIVLMNHGLILASNDFSEILKLQTDIDKCLASPISDKPNAVSKTMKQVDPHEEYDLLAEDHYAQVASNKPLLDFIHGNVLYPDQAIFLGVGIPVLEDETMIQRAISKQIPFFCVKDIGVYRLKSLAVDKRDSLDALIRLLPCLPKPEYINVLSDSQVNELVNWEAEKYRQKLEKII